MSIEFLFDEHHQEQQEKLKNILEVIKRKHFKVDKKARFLRKFTLSCMGQYPKPAMLKHHQEMMKQLKEESAVDKLQQKQQFLKEQVLKGKLPQPPEQLVMASERVVVETPGILTPPSPVKFIAEAPKRI